MTRKRRTRSEEPERTGPNWPAFYRYLAIGCLRKAGVLPMPKEVIERQKQVREGNDKSTALVRKEPDR